MIIKSLSPTFKKRQVTDYHSYQKIKPKCKSTSKGKDFNLLKIDIHNKNKQLN